jgi:hypothetical protein
VVYFAASNDNQAAFRHETIKAMGRTPFFGVCALCLQHRQLCRSHYLGKAIHRLMNRDSPGGQIVFTPKFITQTPRQLAAHLLCRECEEPIAKFGVSTGACFNQSRQNVPFARSHEAGCANRDSCSALRHILVERSQVKGSRVTIKDVEPAPRHYISVCVRL